MIQIWLQVYFPELRFPNIVLPEDQVLAHPLMSAEVPKRSIDEYLMFFRHCTKRSAAQWQVVIRRTYPCFQPGFRLFEKELEGVVARTDFRKKFLSWKARFRDLPTSSIVLQVLFYGWDAWTIHEGEETHKFMVQTIKDINAQVIEDPSLIENIGGQSIHAGEVIGKLPFILAVTSVIAAGDLELPSRDEEDEHQSEQATAEAAPSGRKKRKETAFAQHGAAQPTTSLLTYSRVSLSFQILHRTNLSSSCRCPSIPSRVLLPLLPFAYPELPEFEAMDLDAQLDRLEKLSSNPSKAKSKAVDEAMERQSTELELDEDMEAANQLMRDLDLLHRQNMVPKTILEMSLALARDVLNIHNRYEDLKRTFKTSEFCKATHEANLADYAKQKAELDQMVPGYKEAKATANKLEKQIEEL
ncbi:unnamed protein product, partial [Prunus brigantina]